ncbi:MAG: histidinol dehydrogenase [Pirellulaceae bacterium]|nr:MAG: histidinol dehydrogenase [Pirellulaceae bacterium]
MERPRIELRRLRANDAQFADQLAELRRQLSPDGDVVSPRGRELTERVFGQPLSPSAVVERICKEVASQGREAVDRYSQALDGHRLGDPPQVPRQRLEAAHRSVSPEFLAAVRQIRDNIHAFQSAILHGTVVHRPRAGVCLEQRYTPLRRVGVCVPGGAAAYPSTVLMTVVPAQAAGVEEIAVVAPPTPFGAFNDDMLAVCHELGVHEVYPVGGAQAVAALAYGIDGIPAVDKIVGPGNLFVALAKKFVYGTVDIDSIAGPSEVVVIADDSTDPQFAAADMLAQAEHSPGASLLVTWDTEVADRIEDAINEQLRALERCELTIDSLRAFGAVLIVNDREQACAVTDLIAPEHLHVACRDPRQVADRIRHAGATFIGPFTPVAVGDYAAGPSHVLPTGGTARWASGLSSNSFLRSSSLLEFSADALQAIEPSVSLLAEKEGLTAHRQSVRIRCRHVAEKSN